LFARRLQRGSLSLGTVIVLFLGIASPAVGADIPYGFDANGSLIAGEGIFHEYNDANQLVRIRSGASDGPVVAEYVYDFSGQRFKKTEGSVTCYYVGKTHQSIIGGSDPGETNYYFVDGQRAAKRSPDGEIVYYQADHLGSTIAVTDSSGSLVERTSYFPFGEIRSGGMERYTYTGKEVDSATSLTYYEARYYQRGVAQFTQADQASTDLYMPQSLNRFSYVRNNPVRFIDPTGRTDIDAALERISKTATGKRLAPLAKNVKIVEIDDKEHRHNEGDALFFLDKSGNPVINIDKDYDDFWASVVLVHELTHVRQWAEGRFWGTTTGGMSTKKKMYEMGEVEAISNETSHYIEYTKSAPVLEFPFAWRESSSSRNISLMLTPDSSAKGAADESFDGSE
jgi:RHS repeat-associated protein